MMHKGCKMNEKMKLKPKTKQNATKYKVHAKMKKQGIDQCMTRVAKVCARSG